MKLLLFASVWALVVVSKSCTATVIAPKSYHETQEDCIRAQQDYSSEDTRNVTYLCERMLVRE